MAAADDARGVAPRSNDLPAIADPAWDRVFARSEGWTGGDAMYSVALGADRILWLYADSWIGRVENGRHLAGARLINNALAMHPRGRPGEPPDGESVRFLWGSPLDAKEPLAWIRPELHENGKVAEPTWYWPADGIVVPGPSGTARLLVFLWWMERTAGKGAMSFRSHGGALAVIDNVAEDWHHWQVRQLANPHAISASDGRGRETSWGSELLRLKGGDGEELLYIFGCREGVGQKQLVLARVAIEKVEDFGAWEFRAKAGWASSPTDAASLAEGIANEYSVSRLEVKGQTQWVLVQSEPLLGPRILVRTAEELTGPWSGPRPIYRVPELARNKSYFSYAAKGHPELSPPGELLITYAVNSFDFAALLNDAEIYRPRFIRLPLSALTRHGAD